MKKYSREQLREIDDSVLDLEQHIQLVYDSCLRNQRARDFAKVAHGSRKQWLRYSSITTNSMSKVCISCESYVGHIKRALSKKLM